MKASTGITGDTTMAPGHHHHHFSVGWATRLARPGRHHTDPTPDEVDREQMRVWRDHQFDRRRLIQDVIAHRSLETHVQPIIDLQSGRQVGAEALTRFTTSPQRGPDQWFADAAAVGLGVVLELLAVETAIEQLDLLPSDLYLSINVSLAAILSDELSAVLADVASERIVLELTEDVPLHESPKFEQRLTDLRAQGLRVAVDDGGTSNASFQHILQLKPEIIKLDIGLTRGIDLDPARRSFGRALLNFGLDAYGATFIAEGIETQGELDTLRSLGCPAGQGYLLGRPHRMTMKYLSPFTPLSAQPN